jgi:hypothetical protein
MGDNYLLPPTFPSSRPSLSRKLKTYTPLPAFGCPLTVALDSDRTVGQSGLSPVPTPLVPWGCLDQSCKRLTAGGSSIRTRITWRSSVPRSPGGEAGKGWEQRAQSDLPMGLETANHTRLTGLFSFPQPSVLCWEKSRESTRLTSINQEGLAYSLRHRASTKCSFCPGHSAYGFTGPMMSLSNV